MAVVWTEPEKAKLRAAYAVGRYSAAERAFPHLTRGQVGAGIRRWVLDYANTIEHTADDAITPAEARRRLAGYDAQEFLAGVSRLLENRHERLDRKTA